MITMADDDEYAGAALVWLLSADFIWPIVVVVMKAERFKMPNEIARSTAKDFAVC